MARTAEITFKEFRRRYNTEDACRAELFRLRFPNGFVCPKCGCVEYYPVHGRMGIALAKLAEEDPTFKTYTDEETGQTIIAGIITDHSYSLFSIVMVEPRPPVNKSMVVEIPSSFVPKTNDNKPATS